MRGHNKIIQVGMFKVMQVDEYCIIIYRTLHELSFKINIYESSLGNVTGIRESCAFDTKGTFIKNGKFELKRC